MARPKEFDVDNAVEAAIAVFREHGFEGSSAQMLVDAMGIGRQSLYDTFGDKWGVYRAAVQRYSQEEVRTHAEVLMSRERAIEGIRAMLDRVAGEANRACLGLGATVEFGCSRPDLVKLREASSKTLVRAVKEALVKAQTQGDVATGLDVDHLAAFVIATIASIRLAARAGAGGEQIAALVDLALRALR
ncbi:TetR family transcriptional regulator [Sphingomonas sp. MAH-20]|uniref:TetR family transcriptional regulator n=2 Tax=Sphingomonas TaxID=13687 RepID=A0A6I4IXK1_9SPHN|nr:TetR/AcrR family transcriptional regulator [Sphingomonas horti]MBA2920839.1 TetR/AcrR family transcriptional regulator [Sphingomonas sp. CGMCC 1.13658]MVO76825.1 TetR family transcriptional regulator [Sphingomonas horti]